MREKPVEQNKSHNFQCTEEKEKKKFWKGEWIIQKPGLGQDAWVHTKNWGDHHCWKVE
jgi:hypothetical protein